MPEVLCSAIYIASDHAGYLLKQALVLQLCAQHPTLSVHDLGVHTETSRTDYPDEAMHVAEALHRDPTAMGVLICGSGIGMSMVANRLGLRAALCHHVSLATLARQHNNANILVFGARFLEPNDAIACLNAFLTTPFEGGRHTLRVEKLEACRPQAAPSQGTKSV